MKIKERACTEKTTSGLGTGWDSATADIAEEAAKLERVSEVDIRV